MYCQQSFRWKGWRCFTLFVVFENHRWVLDKGQSKSLMPHSHAFQQLKVALDNDQVLYLFWVQVCPLGSDCVPSSWKDSFAEKGIKLSLSNTFFSGGRTDNILLFLISNFSFLTKNLISGHYGSLVFYIIFKFSNKQNTNLFSTY